MVLANAFLIVYRQGDEWKNYEWQEKKNKLHGCTQLLWTLDCFQIFIIFLVLVVQFAVVAAVANHVTKGSQSVNGSMNQ